MNLRTELEPLPEHMLQLPVHRGYPVPWFVQWLRDDAGEPFPEFRAMSPSRWAQAIKHKLCWVCGQHLGSYLAFVIGPMCGLTRTTSEPPCHLDCALWSARNCPFLSRPEMTRRDIKNDYEDVCQPAGNPIERNPGVTLVWTCRDFEVFSDGKGGPLIHIGNPCAASFFARGRPATRSEIEESINTGIPLLLAAEPAPDAAEELQRRVAEFSQLLPA